MLKKIKLIIFMIVSTLAFSKTIEFDSNNKSSITLKADNAVILFNIESKSNSKLDANKKNKDRIETFLNAIKKYNVEDVKVRNVTNYRSIEKGDLKQKTYKTSSLFYMNIEESEYETIVSKLSDFNISEYSFKNDGKKRLLFTLSEKSDSYKENIIKISDKLNKIEKIIKRDIYLLDVKNKESNEYENLNKYTVKDEIRLKLNDLKYLNEILDLANKSNIYVKGQIDFSISNIQEIYKTLYKNSMDMAYDKANMLFKGYEVKKIVKVLEEKNHRYRRNNDNLLYEIAKSSKEDEKPSFLIPEISVENSLFITMILDDGKKESKSNGEFVISTDVTDKISPNMVLVDFNILTKSYEDIKSSNNTNVKALNKIKELFKLAGITYTDMQSKNYEAYKLKENKIRKITDKKPKNKTTFEIGVKNLKSKDFKDLLSCYYIKGVPNKNYDFILKIEEIDENNSLSYKKAKNKYDKLVKKYGDSEFKLIKITNDRISNEKTIKEEKEVYNINHRITFETKELDKVPLILAIFKELGINATISFGVDDIKLHTEKIYQSILKNIDDKKEALTSTKYVNLGGIKKVTENYNNLNSNISNTRYVRNGDEVLNLNISNDEIIKRANENLTYFNIENYEIYLYIDAVIEIND